MSEEEDEKQALYREFNDRVNMAPKELEEWLKTEASQEAGWKHEDGESVGHESGRRIVAIRHSRKAELTDDDYEHMRRVIAYIKRHGAQGPTKSDPADSRWRASLMNWGHDPLKSP